jgi:hypothetical protein
MTSSGLEGARRRKTGRSGAGTTGWRIPSTRAHTLPSSRSSTTTSPRQPGTAGAPSSIWVRPARVTVPSRATRRVWVKQKIDSGERSAGSDRQAGSGFAGGTAKRMLWRGKYAAGTRFASSRVAAPARRSSIRRRRGGRNALIRAQIAPVRSADAVSPLPRRPSPRRFLVDGGQHDRDDGANDLEILVLRHQLRVLQRTAGRPSFRVNDRDLLAAASRVIPRARADEAGRVPDAGARRPRADLRAPLERDLRLGILSLARPVARGCSGACPSDVEAQRHQHNDQMVAESAAFQGCISRQPRCGGTT